MANLLWGIVVVLFIFWLLGLTVLHLGSIIHLALIVIVVLVVINLITGRGARV